MPTPEEIADGLVEVRHVPGDVVLDAPAWHVVHVPTGAVYERFTRRDWAEEDAAQLRGWFAHAARLALETGLDPSPLSAEREKTLREWVAMTLGLGGRIDHVRRAAAEAERDLLAALDHARAQAAWLAQDSHSIDAWRAGWEAGRRAAREAAARPLARALDVRLVQAEIDALEVPHG